MNYRAAAPESPEHITAPLISVVTLDDQEDEGGCVSRRLEKGVYRAKRWLMTGMQVIGLNRVAE